MPNRTLSLKYKIIRKLLNKRATRNNSVELETLLNWFVKSEQGDVQEHIHEMVDDPTMPISRSENMIYISDVNEAINLVMNPEDAI